MSGLTRATQLQAMLAVEVALAEALVDAGEIPATAASAIAAAAREASFDLDDLHAQSAAAGNVAIPFVSVLTRLVAAIDPAAAGHVHRGATSQDILDTALVLQLREAHSRIAGALTVVMEAAAALARAHATTPMPGRTWLQHASPTTFGLTAAGWLDMAGRCSERLADACARAMVLQLGGASGTLAALGDAAPRVLAAMAERLTLAVPEMPWHTQRDRLADVAAALGITCGALGKIGRDLVLLAQTDVREAYDVPDPGRGGSSSMPHKQNPVRAVAMIAASVRAPGLVATLLTAMPQEHERAAGGWQAEWAVWPALVDLADTSAAAGAEALTHLRVDAARMRANLDAQGGVAMAEALTLAIAEHVGRPDALAIVERLCRQADREGRALRDVTLGDGEARAHLHEDAIVRALTPARFLGSAPLFVNRVLERWRL